MKKKIIIPDKCRIGFRFRKGTYDGKLSYVTYYDTSGKLRKEKSWKSWCTFPIKDSDPTPIQIPGLTSWRELITVEHIQKTQELEPKDFDNVPTSGFVLNKGVQRYNWHSGPGRSMVRIYDPRGWEFEIDVENLMILLMHEDCTKRQLSGEFVYSWRSGELILLPCSSVLYEEAKKVTKLQEQKIYVKDLKIGTWYVTKNNDLVLYIGRHKNYQESFEDIDTYWCTVRKGKMSHIFWSAETDTFIPTCSVPSLIAKVADSGLRPVDSDVSLYIDRYLSMPDSSPIISFSKTLVPWEVIKGSKDRDGTLAVQKGDKYYTGRIVPNEDRRRVWSPGSCLPFRCGLDEENIDEMFAAEFFFETKYEYTLNGPTKRRTNFIPIQETNKIFNLAAVYKNGYVKKLTTWGGKNEEPEDE